MTDDTSDALPGAYARLEHLLDTSIAAMRAGAPIDDSALATAKSRALYELSRLAPAARGADDAARAVHARLRSKLLEEGRLLGRRLDAAELIAGIVTEAAILAQSDGTYDRQPQPLGSELAR